MSAQASLSGAADVSRRSGGGPSADARFLTTGEAGCQSDRCAAERVLGDRRGAYRRNGIRPQYILATGASAPLGTETAGFAAPVHRGRHQARW